MPSEPWGPSKPLRGGLGGREASSPLGMPPRGGLGGSSPLGSSEHDGDQDAEIPAGATARQQLEAAFGLALRRTGSLMQLISHAAAERIGINSTDLNCLNVLALAGQMTAGELARATGLTTASITGVVDRLEEAGYVRRERDARDRRRVVIHAILERALRDIGPVFLPIVQAWQAVAARYTDAELTLILEFQRQTEQLLRDHLARLRDTAPGG